MDKAGVSNLKVRSNSERVGMHSPNQGAAFSWGHLEQGKYEKDQNDGHSGDKKISKIAEHGGFPPAIHFIMLVL